MEDNFATYRKFIFKDDALDLIEILKEHRIDFILSDNSSRLDSTFGNDDNTKQFALKIERANFKKVEELEEDLISKSLDNVNKDYYLFEFSDEELIEIVLKSEEWNKFDYLLAQKILKERGKEVNLDLIKAINKRRIDDLKTEEASPKWLIYIGYLFSVLGGLIGIFIGLYLMNYKKTLPNGETIYGFGTEDRKSGKNVFICSIIGVIFWFIVRLILINR
ncbi:hypothetical protein GCM10010992_13250 [Cloacibacterium rupense]|uniref:DUF2007 domain-containing protein n=1 Tax=Cloacibacterium rupense TaxID=517423 RepID=A0ABQ2NJ09_9FLAO|nr:hypothetical protein GCM10010992_13250 [Cloacibacterium rupense]